jgi:hypothetical protein
MSGHKLPTEYIFKGLQALSLPHRPFDPGTLLTTSSFTGSTFDRRSMLDVANLVGVGVQEVVGAIGVLDIDLDAEVTKQRVIL